MATIKTKESMQTVKTFDRLQNLASKTRSGAEEAKQSINDATEKTAVSENQYAGNQLQGYERGTARLTVLAGDKLGRWGVKETRRNVQRWNHRKNRYEIKVEVRKGNELSEPKKTKKIEAPKTSNKAKKTSVQATKGSIKTTTKTVKTTKKTVKTSAKVAEKTAKATEKAAKATAKAAKAAAKAAKAAAQATIKFVKVAVKAIVAVAKAVVAAVKGIVAAIAAGGWVAVVVILVICLIGGLIAGICAVFVPNDSGGYTVNYMMEVCKNEYNARVDEIAKLIPHDYFVIEGDELSEKEVIAVFAVLTGTSGDDISTLDAQRQEEFRSVFDTMYSFSNYCTENEEVLLRQYTNEEGNISEVKETITLITLHIQKKMLSAEEASLFYSFDEKQNEFLDILCSVEFDKMWSTLLK